MAVWRDRPGRSPAPRVHAARGVARGRGRATAGCGVSAPAVARVPPSGLNAAACAPPACAAATVTGSPASVSRERDVAAARDRRHEAAVGTQKATAVIGPLRPEIVRTGAPVAASHTVAVGGADGDQISRPSELHATPPTWRPAPLSRTVPAAPLDLVDDQAGRRSPPLTKCVPRGCERDGVGGCLVSGLRPRSCVRSRTSLAQRHGAAEAAVTPRVPSRREGNAADAGLPASAPDRAGTCRRCAGVPPAQHAVGIGADPRLPPGSATMPPIAARCP